MTCTSGSIERDSSLCCLLATSLSSATAESGTGSHRRRVALLEGHVRTEAPRMFDAAAKAIVERLTALRKDLGTRLEKEVVEASLGALLTAYAPLWDEMGDECLATRRAMRPKCAELCIEANNAVRRMRAASSGGGGAAASSSAADGADGGGGNDDDDDDLVETTAFHQQARPGVGGGRAAREL